MQKAPFEDRDLFSDLIVSKFLDLLKAMKDQLGVTRAQAASLVGISRMTLYRKIDYRQGIELLPDYLRLCQWAFLKGLKDFPGPQIRTNGQIIL